MSHLCVCFFGAQAVMALQFGSKFADAYQKGVHKSKYWEPYLEDSLNLIAKLPEVGTDCSSNIT